MRLGTVVTRADTSFDPGVYLNLQVKSTIQGIVDDDTVRYDLDARTYGRLRKSTAKNPLLLVILVMPDDEAGWLSQSPDELILRHCAYWLLLDDYPAMQATSSVRVTIPRANIFSVTFVQAMMQQLLERNQP